MVSLKILNKFIKILTLCFGVIFFSSSSKLYAATYTITPTSGFVKVGDSFVVDIKIDSEGEKSNLARAVLTFDPSLVQLTKAERNNSLYTTFQADQQTTDNTNGVVMITGFTQSGNGTLYKTASTPDLFARLTFKAIKSGTVKFEWEYTGSDSPFKSVIMIDGSPAQNKLTIKPSSVAFTIQGSGGTTSGGTGTTPVTGVSSNIAFYLSAVAIIGAGLIFSGGGVLYNASRKVFNTSKKTLVEIENR